MPTLRRLLPIRLRWWNIKHPVAWSQRIKQRESPAAAREILSPEQQLMEEILLQTRMVEGMAISSLPMNARGRVAELIADELVDAAAALRGRLKLTLKGRLLADVVVLTLTR